MPFFRKRINARLSAVHQLFQYVKSRYAKQRRVVSFFSELRSWRQRRFSTIQCVFDGRIQLTHKCKTQCNNGVEAAFVTVKQKNCRQRFTHFYVRAYSVDAKARNKIAQHFVI